MKASILFLALLVGCGGATDGASPSAEVFAQCEVHTRHLFGNVNGCWRITSRQGFVDSGKYMCSAQPTCEVITGDEQDYISGDVAWVGDVACDNTCSP